MHLINTFADNRRLTAIETDAVTAAERANPAAVIAQMKLDAATWRAIGIDDTLLLARNSSNRGPRSNATVQEPVRVVLKVERSARGSKTVVCAARPDAPTSKWGSVRDAIITADTDGLGEGYEFSARARAAVFDHFARLPEPPR